MVTYTVYMKELSATSTWQDITHAVVENKDIPVRKGFSSLSDGIDVGSLTLTIHMETLQDAALLHVSQKQVLVQADSVTIFEGVSYDDADIDVEERSDYVFTKLKFKPYSALFKEAKVPEDTVWMDKKICDPEDTENSLVHLLFGMIVENLPGNLPDILAALFNVSTAITNTKTLALVMLEAGESVEGYLTELLYQNGYAYWMELYAAIVVEPYATGRTPTVNIPITSVVANPDISQAPYVDEKKCVVRLGKIEEYTDEVVYELNGERYEDSGEPTQVQVLEPGDYYPLDSDEAPSELEADYETERENDDIELVYVTGATLDVHTRALSGDSTVRVHITAGTHELDPTKARIQLYNNLTYDVSLRNIRVLAQTAYYRNWAERYYDEGTTASEEDETDGIWMPDAATARAFVSRYRAELKAQATHVTFQTHVALQPNSLITVTGLPYKLLVRYVTKLEEGFCEYECVAYSVEDVSVGGKIAVVPKRTPRDGSSPIPVRLYALGDDSAPFEDSERIADDTYVLADDYGAVGIDNAWSETRPTPGEGQYVWYKIGYYTPPATWPLTWTTPVRDEGLTAYALQISAPEGTTIRMSGRGVLQTTSLKFTAILSNILPASVVWAASNGALNLVAGDDYSRTLDCSTVSADSVTITITATVGGKTYSASIGVQRIRDTLVAAYGGVSDTLLTSMDGEPLAIGDTFLYMPMDGEEYDDTDPLFGHVLKWDGDSWESTTDSQSIGFAAKDAFQIARESGKVIFAAVIYTEAMVASNIQAGSGTGLAGSGFRFRAMDDDYSQEGAPKVPVFDIYKDDKQLFKVDVSNGNIYFGAHFWYDPADGAIHTPNDKTVIKADGTISAVDGSFSGDVFAHSGFFKGIFDTTALKLEPGDTTAHNFTQASSINQAQNFFNALSSFGMEVNIFYKASTSVSSIQMYIRWGSNNWTSTVDLSDLSYIRINNANSSGGVPVYELKLYDSTKTLIPCSTQSVFSGYSLMYLSSTSYIMTTTSFTITVYTGGDKLIVSPEIPDNPVGLADYQIYHSNGSLHIKLP